MTQYALIDLIEFLRFPMAIGFKCHIGWSPKYWTPAFLKYYMIMLLFVVKSWYFFIGLNAGTKYNNPCLAHSILDELNIQYLISLKLD
jgi:hypothetical protein